jgi:hypothetical protein
MLTVKTPLLNREGGLWRVAEGDEIEDGVVDFRESATLSS